jgi:hypothetical protein
MEIFALPTSETYFSIGFVAVDVLAVEMMNMSFPLTDCNSSPSNMR